jgi:hypothetical protein
VTAADAIDHARAAGLTLERTPVGLKVRGPGDARARLRPVLAALTDEILRLLPPENLPTAAPAAYVPDRRACLGCGRSGFTVMVVTGCGDHLCRPCWRSTTAEPDVRHPATPTLDRLMADADARAERDGGAL